MSSNPAKTQDGDLTGTWIDEIARLVNEITGVKLGTRQGAMLEARLVKRMMQLGYQEPEAYLDFIRNNLEEEVPKLVALLTTHHTFFFREYAHFQYLEDRGLAVILEKVRARGDKTLRVWSAACSQGQEVYSLAMFLHHHLHRMAPDIKLEILGSDVDPESVGKAQNGVYRWADLKQVPLAYLYNHWVRGTGDIADYAKAKASIRSLCSFKLINLSELATQGPAQMYDIIFCRNVFIYFEAELIKSVTENLLKRLHPHGLLFIGLSESLINTGLPVVSLAPSVYGPKGSLHVNWRPSAPSATPSAAPTAPAAAVTTPAAVAPTAQVAPAPTPVAPPRKAKVFCVDDSPTILALLKRILEPEFEIIGTAKSGLEASQKLKTLRPDLMTLDIHMPEQGGIEYLEKNFNPTHPPVIILSSVPREDSAQAMRCLELGARDYIEKPELAELETRADEIRTKVRCVLQTSEHDMPRTLELDRSFHQQQKITTPEKKLRLIFAGAADRGKLAFVLRECIGVQPPSVLVIEGAVGLLPSLAKAISELIGAKCEVLDNPATPIEAGKVYVADFQKTGTELANRHATRQSSILILGMPTDAAQRMIARFTTSEVILEDSGSEIPPAAKGSLHPQYYVPYTSMGYHSNKFLTLDPAKLPPKK